MSVRNFFAKHQKAIVQYVLPAVGALVALGVVWFVVGSSSSKQSEVDLGGSENIAQAAEETTSSPESQNTEVAVYVAGGVVHPGVYRLPSGSLIADAIEAAGGFSKECDQGSVEQSLNLAQPISDGLKVYVPKKGDVVAGTAQPPTEPSNTAPSASSSGKVSINNASKGELMDLYGIGEVYSQKIIDSRPYSSIEDLISKDVIPNATFEKIKEEISL